MEEKGKYQREGRKSLVLSQPPAPAWISPFFTLRARPSETHSPSWQTMMLNCRHGEPQLADTQRPSDQTEASRD